MLHAHVIIWHNPDVVDVKNICDLTKMSYVTRKHAWHLYELTLCITYKYAKVIHVN